MVFKKHVTAWAVLLFLVAYVVLGLVATQLDLKHDAKANHFGFWAEVVIAALMLTLMLAVGWAAKGRLDGIVIDARNRVTLGHFQLVVWTLVVVSSFGAAVLTNLMANRGLDSLKVTVPPELWLAMGISATTFVGSKAIKRTMQPSQLASNAQLGEADWADMFTSDVATGEGSIDLSKLQMFFFTVVLAFGYAVAVADTLLNTTGPIEDLPRLDTGFVTLLAISHGGYLTRKAAHKIG